MNWIMEYIKRSLLVKIGFINILWIFLSYLEVIFHNPYTEYKWWNYFDLIAMGTIQDRYEHDILCGLTHIILGLIIIVTILYFLTCKRKGVIDIYVILMSAVLIGTCMSLITVKDDLCTFAGMIIEILYLCGLASELSIER